MMSTLAYLGEFDPHPARRGVLPDRP
ncbi:hypothetical protein BCEP4_1350043 [Burkholderia cepacia]|nr:hypothetical protein BCEP4_1350043 [Burkholderia cepacia]